ncbi:MAG TPA: sigma-70 family RNA polymerase sigma factor [Candidatus Atribacteria bacterium]|nr:sigma-70 family RNA polymerase sigma factor [Candidatus Atribacteria bacterium]HPT78919.1 sigma-70 family RNA polymerase sigma factor [Candidatus Atribacteria bacterium]
MLPIYLSLIDTQEDRDKFEELYYKYRDLMYYVAFGILRDTYLAEDAVQAAFMRIINNLGKLDTENCHKTKAFVVIVVENVAKSMYSKRKKQSAVSFDELQYEVSDDANDLDNIINKLDVAEIVSKIKLLPETDRNILTLKYVYDMGNKEIADILNIKGAAMRKRLERARQRLSTLLRENGGYDY